MEYDYTEKKIVAVLASNLEIGIAFNVLGHLGVSLSAVIDSSELIGKEVLTDASGISHLGIAKYPFIITKIKPAKLRKMIHRVRNEHPNLIMADYPEQMLHTNHDAELVEALANEPEENLMYFGAILYGDSNEINTITGKFSLWK